MQAKIKQRLRRYGLYALFAAPLLASFHYAMTQDKESLCNSGQMYGQECYK